MFFDMFVWGPWAASQPLPYLPHAQALLHVELDDLSVVVVAHSLEGSSLFSGFNWLAVLTLYAHSLHDVLALFLVPA
jgi:hypothetical protein